MTFETVTGREQTSPSTGECFLCVRPEPGRLEDEETEACPVAAGPSRAGRLWASPPPEDVSQWSCQEGAVGTGSTGEEGGAGPP